MGNAKGPALSPLQLLRQIHGNMYGKSVMPDLASVLHHRSDRGAIDSDENAVGQSASPQQTYA